MDSQSKPDRSRFRVDKSRFKPRTFCRTMAEIEEYRAKLRIQEKEREEFYRRQEYYATASIQMSGMPTTQSFWHATASPLHSGGAR